MRVCIEPGCTQAGSGPRCPQHERAFQRARNADPKRKAYKDPAYVALPRGSCCTCCGTTEDLTRHHIYPLARRTDPVSAGLITPMCRSCNSSIGAKVMADHRCPKHGGIVAP